MYIGRTLAMTAGIVVVLAALRGALSKYLRYRNPYGQVFASFLMCIAGWIVLRIHLYVIEPFYLRFGPKYWKNRCGRGAVQVMRRWRYLWRSAIWRG
jgi:hypothetical protein